MQNNDKNADIDAHRSLTLVSGNLSEFQLTNLKTWPFIVFSDLEKVTISYNFLENLEGGDVPSFCAGTVEFDCCFKDGKLMTELAEKKARNQLIIWTKFLFWKDTKVLFKKDGKLWN